MALTIAGHTFTSEEAHNIRESVTPIHGRKLRRMSNGRLISQIFWTGKRQVEISGDAWLQVTLAGVDWSGEVTIVTTDGETITGFSDGLARSYDQAARGWQFTLRLIES